ncbi:MAG TPA: hypothetical protein VFI27_06335, partial [candidate division Zixibacteria bacterium]|nr:hypothetical protein [candidate division Zixibacteria bacterium]
VYVSPTVPELEEDVNLRNLQMANQPAAYYTQGIYIEALGYMPAQYYAESEIITINLTPIDVSLGEGAVYVRHFDFDYSAPPPVITFTIDTVPIDPEDPGNPTPLFWRATITESNPIQELSQASCMNGTNCNNSWSYPQYQIGIPVSIFAGGTLQVTFVPHGESFVWSTTVITGRPVLTD